MCHFVPAYILQHIADSEAAPEEARRAAIRTLSADQDFREQRLQALASGVAPTVPDDSDVSAGQATIVSLGVAPPSILEHVAQGELADDENRRCARATLRSDANSRIGSCSRWPCRERRAP